MRVFVAGGTGAVGQSMIPKLIEAGHEVFAISRREEKLEPLRRLGIEGVQCDVFDAPRLGDVVRAVRPAAIVHQLTDLPVRMDPRQLRQTYERNDRVRRDGTRHLLSAAAGASVRRFVVQSMATWYRPEGDTVRRESDPLWTDAPEPLGAAVRTVANMESAVLSSVPAGVVLRYGGFYGPGTWYAPDAEVAQRLRARQFPVLGGGAGTTSFIHVDDAAGAAVAALSAPAGVYNIVDDAPARASEWVPFLASLLGAPPPRRVPAWLARLVVGKALTAWMTMMRGASNEKARRELGWTPRYADWRTGMRDVFAPGR